MEFTMLLFEKHRVRFYSFFFCQKVYFTNDSVYFLVYVHTLETQYTGKKNETCCSINMLNKFPSIEINPYIVGGK